MFNVAQFNLLRNIVFEIAFTSSCDIYNERVDIDGKTHTRAVSFSLCLLQMLFNTFQGTCNLSPYHCKNTLVNVIYTHI